MTVNIPFVLLYVLVFVGLVAGAIGFFVAFFLRVLNVAGTRRIGRHSR